MIIVEGPDGSGKTTLIRKLVERYPISLELHPRASHGVDGPVPDLYEWARDDVATWRDQPLSIYDRHPLVSEYIYGPIIRGGMDPRFHTSSSHRLLARRALTIVCLPPLDTVRRAVSDERDMPGVTTHINAIWHSYASLSARWPSGVSLEYYDWTKARDLIAVCARINHHIDSWRSYDH